LKRGCATTPRCACAPVLMCGMLHEREVPHRLHVEWQIAEPLSREALPASFSESPNKVLARSFLPSCPRSLCVRAHTDPKREAGSWPLPTSRQSWQSPMRRPRWSRGVAET
jgi:hypothetical protein